MATATSTGGTVALKPIDARRFSVRIVGTSPLIQHAWSQKAILMMRDKHAGKKTKTRDVRDPGKEAKEAAYYMPDGVYAVPLMAIKSAIISAAHKDLGIEKTLVRKALFLRAPVRGSMNTPMVKHSEPFVREDQVRVGNDSADLRYRPQFDEWEVELDIEYDHELLQPADIVNLINRAGFGVGIGEWRPEKSGEFGRFAVVTPE